MVRGSVPTYIREERRIPPPPSSLHVGSPTKGQLAGLVTHCDYLLLRQWESNVKKKKSRQGWIKVNAVLLVS